MSKGKTRFTRLIVTAMAAGLAGASTLAFAAEETDWPMWRYDAARSANTPLELEEELHLQWVRELPEPKRAWPHQWDNRGKLEFDVSYAPVVMGGRIFVPSNVTDSVTAYNIEDGAEEWRFYTDGPVRLAPVAWEGKVYFVSDDGHLYCVDAESGEQLWKFQGGPSEDRLLGNERIINFWAARGGPVIKEGTIYFAAGVWPLHGVFVYALNAENGEKEWVNDTTSSDYVSLPHGGAKGFGGLAPQGYLAAGEDDLVVSGGRALPAVFDRHTGEVLENEYRAKPDGGFAVDAEGLAYNRNEMIQDRVDALSDQIEGEVFSQFAARDRLFVTTEDGAVYCFGPEEVDPVHHEYSPATLRPQSADWAATAQRLLDELGESEGYGLILGAGSGDLLREVLYRSDLHLVVVEDDADAVQSLREELVETGMYGRRAAVIEADPASFSVQPYLFSMVLSEDAQAAGIEPDTPLLASLLDGLRPYGGVAYLGASVAQGADLSEAVFAAASDLGEISVQAPADFPLVASKMEEETTLSEAAAAADVDQLTVQTPADFPRAERPAETVASLSEAAMGAGVDQLSVETAVAGESRTDERSTRFTDVAMTAAADVDQLSVETTEEADGSDDVVGSLSQAALAAGVDQVFVEARRAAARDVAAQRLRALADAASAAGVDQLSVERRRDSQGRIAMASRADFAQEDTLLAREDFVFAVRGGPLSGAGEWTHQYHDPANTLLSEEERVKLPLGLLWFGGPNNHNILPRHAGGPRPVISGGRQVYLGVDNVAARCVYTGRQLWDVEYPGIGHPFTNLELEKRWADGEEVYMTNIPGVTYIGSPLVALSDAIYLRYGREVHRLDPATGETVDEFSLPGQPVAEIDDDEDAPEWGHISVQGDYLIVTAEPHVFEDQELGGEGSYTGTSSRLLAVMDRNDGEVLWTKEADIGFRHGAIVSTDGMLYVIDGLSENALDSLVRRGEEPDEDVTRIYALDLETGEEVWSSDSNVFGTYLLYSAGHDILIEGGSRDMRRPFDDEPRQVTARSGADGEILWETDGFTLPGALRGDMLIPGRPGNAISVLTGETWQREQPHTGETSSWSYERTYGCNTLNASQHLLLFRSSYAGYFDLEHDTGTGTFSGFKSGCTANMIAADGVLNALDYTRTCTCSYPNQTSLAMVHMPGDSNIESWTKHEASPPDPAGYGLNLGAPGRRVDHEADRVWHDAEGSHRRHPSAIVDNGGGIDWVAASGREFSIEAAEAEDREENGNGDAENEEENANNENDNGNNNEGAEEENGEDENDVEKKAASITVYDLLETEYTVRLHFAELTEGVEAGERVFDVLIDGEEVLSGYDIVAEAGGCFHGVVEEFTVDANMTMEIELRKAEDSQLDPFLNGIEVVANDTELATAE
ncbi:MAG: PQQ-binding-like beta-propeller repeat protein [Candidatus Hydrogenedentota bacterium]